MQRFRMIGALAVLLHVFGAGVSFAEAKKDAHGTEGGGGGMEYVEMDPLLLPVIDEDGVQQVVSMVISIEVDGISDADKVKAMKPRLADAYIQDMYGVLNEHAALKGGIIQVRVIKKRLNEITDRVVGSDINTEVLIQLVQQRPI